MMKKFGWNLKLGICLLGLSHPVHAGDRWFSKSSTPIELIRAHKAYLEKDFQTTTNEVVAALKSDQAEVRKNAMALWRSALLANPNSKIPVDWNLPSEIMRMNADLSYVSIQDELEYDFRVKGEMLGLGSLSQLQIVQYPSKVILDKQAGIGQWDEKLTEEGAHFELKGKRSKEPIPEGLYLINIEVANGNRTNGWFIVSDMASTATPKFLYPSNGETVKTGNPTIRWSDFKSPEYKNSDLTSHSLWIETEETKENQWDFYQFNGRTTQTTVGTDPLGKGVKSLANGSYFMVLTYNEGRKFGDMRLRRTSKAMTTFNVKLD